NERRKACEEPQTVPHHGTANGKSRLKITVVVLFWLIYLGACIESAAGCASTSSAAIRRPGGVRIITQSKDGTIVTLVGAGNWRCICRIGFVGSEQLAVESIAAFLHDHIDHAAKSATVFGFDARSLDLNFLNELERNISAGISAGNVLRILAFDEIAVLR